MLSGCLPGTAYKEGKGPPHTNALGEGRGPTPAGAKSSLREPGVRRGRRRTEASPSRCAHSLADHTFNNPILRTHHPKGLWHRGDAHLHGAHTLMGLRGSQGLTLRISLEPKPESMRVSRSMSRMAQATSRCRLGPGSPVHSTWRARGRGHWQSLRPRPHPGRPHALPTSHQPPHPPTSLSASVLPLNPAGAPPTVGGHLGRGIPS